jgi:hypothetical protein
MDVSVPFRGRKIRVVAPIARKHGSEKLQIFWDKIMQVVKRGDGRFNRTPRGS